MTNTPTNNRDRADAYVELVKDILGIYVQLYPNYAWTDPHSAIYLMLTEIITLREELRKERLSLR